jgi:putative hydrolase of the HAD superfamily
MAATRPSDAVDRAVAVLFDLFHTLTSIDMVKTWKRPTHEILGVTKEAWLEQVFGESRDRLIGKVRDPMTMMRAMARAIDESISLEVIEEATRNRARRFHSALTHMPDATRDALAALKAKGKKLGLVSNADAMEIAAWDESPVAGLFDCVAFSCDVGYAKPEPEIYEICLGKLGVRPDEAVFVGDGGSDELKGAKALGLTTVMMTGVIKEMWPERIEPRLPYADFVIEELNELVSA